MKEKCRLCLCLIPNCSGISINNAQLKEELQTVFRFDIVCGPNLPEYVCDECRGQVSHIHTYNQQVWDNQQLLLNKANGAASQPEEHLFEENVFDVKELKQEVDIPDELQIEFVLPSLEPDGSIGEERRDFGIIGDEDDLVEQEKNQNETGERPTCSKANKTSSEKPKTVRSNQKANDKIIKDFFTLECELCSAPSESFGALVDHYRADHDIKGYVRCCNKQYFNRSYLVDHIGAHKGLSRCEICQRSYKSKRYLTQHMTECHSQGEAKPFKCPQCHMAYSKEHLLRGHMTMHVKKQCQFCQKVLSNHYSLKLHIAQVHSGDGHQICATCGKVFRTNFAMERHIKLHHQPQLVNWQQCDQCEKWFDCKENLKKHVRLRHDERGQFPCDQCEHVSVNRRSLVFHKNRIHKQRQLFDCKHCGKKLLSKLGLREHLATHSNVPLYSCDFCDVTFNSSANKYKHYKSKHFKEWEELKHQRLLEKMSVAPVQIEAS